MPGTHLILSKVAAPCRLGTVNPTRSKRPRAMAPMHRPNLVTVMAKATSPTVRGGSPGHRYLASSLVKLMAYIESVTSLNPMGLFY